MKRINVTKTFLPPLQEYEDYLKQIWENGQLTNQGPLLHEFEEKLKKKLEVSNLHFVANGTLSLQIAFKALDITEGEVITTPFSYVASVSAILWERLKPVFVDIDSETFSIDTNKIEAAITTQTKAIMAVHIYGMPCNIEAIEAIARKHSLAVIYDGAQGFGTKYNSESLLGYGDISICSFHSTKLFHTIEGGCVIAKDKKISEKVELVKRFGHHLDEHYMLGINAKASEFQSAMGLCNLNYVDRIIADRKKVSELYDSLLLDKIERPKSRSKTEYNYSYYPVLLKSEQALNEALAMFAKQNIFPRRYFYPSLNTLPYLKDKQSCPVAEGIAKRVLCLPLYGELKSEDIERICKVLL